MTYLLGVFADGGFGSGHMDGWGWGGAVVAVAMVGVVAWMVRGAAGGAALQDPDDVLRGRYARGEVTTEEFEERLRTIASSRR